MESSLLWLELLLGVVGEVSAVGVVG